jgi:hypothetical protein
MANRTIDLGKEEPRRSKPKTKTSLESMARAMNEIISLEYSTLCPIAMDKENKGEETVRMAEAVLDHLEPVIVRLGALQLFQAPADWAPPASGSLESLKAGANPGVAHAVELEQVGDTPGSALRFYALTRWRPHSERFAASNYYPAVDSVESALSCLGGAGVLMALPLRSQICWNETCGTCFCTGEI